VGRALWTKLEPHLQGSAYVNHLAADDQPRRCAHRSGKTMAAWLKAAYDPKNLFRINANIAP